MYAFLLLDYVPMTAGIPRDKHVFDAKIRNAGANKVMKRADIDDSQ